MHINEFWLVELTRSDAMTTLHNIIVFCVFIDDCIGTLWVRLWRFQISVYWRPLEPIRSTDTTSVSSGIRRYKIN